VRTTLTLDEDVADKLRFLSRRTGRSFKQVVNEALRRGLDTRHEEQPLKPFRVRARRLGLRPGLSYDNVGELLDQLEGPDAP
jgi:hypothetical protein